MLTQWGCEKFIKKKSVDLLQAISPKFEHLQLILKVQKHKNYPTKDEKNKNFALLKQKEIEKSYGSMKKYLDKCSIDCKVAKQGSIFVTAEGLLMPCCWTAGRMYKWWHEDPRVEQVWDHIDYAGGKQGISIIDNDIKHVVNGKLISSITDSWQKDSVARGKLGVCAPEMW